MLILEPIPAGAQETEAPAWYHVIVVDVKPDRVTDFEGLAREMSAAQARADNPVAQVFEVMAGEGPSFHVAIPMASLAMNDNPRPPMDAETMAAWQQRANGVISATKNFYARVISTLSAADNMPASLVVLRSVKVAVGKEDEFMDWVDKELMPAMKKAKMAVTYAQGIFGDSPQNFYFVSPVPNWAAFDGQDPLTASMGEKDMTRMLDKVNAIVVDSSLMVMRPRPDLAPQQ